MKRRSIPSVSGTLATLAIGMAAASTGAFAEWYPDWDSRSPNYQQYLQKQREEFDERQRKEQERSRQLAEEMYGPKPDARTPQERARGEAQRRDQDGRDAQHRADFKAARAKLLRMPPLPDERNLLLGRWRVEGQAKTRGRSELDQLMGMLANPGGAACTIVFGGGIVEFRSKSWASIDGSGDDSLGPIAYRADGKRVWAIPDKGVELMGFEFADADRVAVINLDGCTLVRADATSTAKVGRSDLALARPKATPPPDSANVSARPSPEVCRKTLLDKLGSVALAQARQDIGVRFKEVLTGTVPNSQNLRLDARGSACDDPRLNATLYDFDASGLLQSITFVWARPAGPAPAPIFDERVTTLTRFHALPAPQSSGRLQADTSLGRLIIQDMPERNLLLEAYAAKK